MCTFKFGLVMVNHVCFKVPATMEYFGAQMAWDVLLLSVVVVDVVS